MGRFLTPLEERCLNDSSNDYRGHWELISPLGFKSSVAKREIWVPKGSKSDHASVPRWPVIFWLFGEVTRQGAWVHDHLYKTGEVPRVLADAILKEACRATGVSGWRTFGIWAGVRVGGWASYKAKK